MNQKDVLWQALLDEEKQRLSSLPTEELLSMESFTTGVIQSSEMLIEYGVWHSMYSEEIEVVSEEAESLSAQLDQSFGIQGQQREIHSFVLKARRTLFPGLYRNYLSGFSLNEVKRIIPIAEEVLGAYD